MEQQSYPSKSAGARLLRAYTTVCCRNLDRRNIGLTIRELIRIIWKGSIPPWHKDARDEGCESLLTMALCFDLSVC